MVNNPSSHDDRSAIKSRFRSAFLIPILAFFGLALALGWGLTRDPKILPSALIDEPVPEFDLPPVKGRARGLATGDLQGEVSLVNVFASWCIPCRAEHPLLVDLSRRQIVPIHGLNYKDKQEDASKWLTELGDSYTRTGADIDGRVGIEWGVYGVPETFVIGKDGRIAYKYVGPLSKEILNDVILPIVGKLNR